MRCTRTHTISRGSMRITEGSEMRVGKRPIGSRPMSYRALLLFAIAAGAMFGIVQGVWRSADISDDAFWRATYVRGTSQYHFDALSEMAASPQTELIAVGVFGAVEKSRSWIAVEEIGLDGVATYVRSRLTIERTLKGDPDTAFADVEFFLPNASLLEATTSAAVNDRVLLFLTPVEDVDETLYRLVTGQGYIRDHGRAEPPVFVEDEWLADVGLRQFEAVVSDVEDMALGSD